MMDVIALLDEFRRTRRDEAFRELARRHTRLIYSVAQRRVHDFDLARDVAQEVLTRFAQSPPAVRTSSELIGWLHRTTLHVAVDTWRSHVRRQTREAKVAIMEEPVSAPESSWSEIAPELDEAVDQLESADREAILLRFFAEKSMREIGDNLGIAEDAAKMRVNRALDRLRKLLVARGITCTSAVLGERLAQHTLVSMPGAWLERLIGSTSPSLSHAPSAPPGSRQTTIIPWTWIKGLGWGIPGVTALLVAGLATTWIARSIGDNENPPPTLASTSASSAERQHPKPPRSIQALFRRSQIPSISLNAPPDARDQLRALLRHPSTSGRYPPPALTDALGRFGGDLIEAVPILVEAGFTEDYETRAWALSGLEYVAGRLQREGFPEGQRQQLLRQTESLFRKILPNPDEPAMLRQFVLEALVPSTIRIHGTTVGKPPQLPAPAWSTIETTLTRSGAMLDPFKFTLVDHLAAQWSDLGSASDTMLTAASRLTASDGQSDRWVGAYALAVWPGAKPSHLKEILVAELKTRSTYSFKAATALGCLGVEAKEAAVDLLQYAEAMERLPNQNYSQRALEAACRLDPSLAARFPEAAARLEQNQRPADADRAVIKPIPLVDWILTTLNQPNGEAQLAAWLDHSGDPEAARRQLIEAVKAKLPDTSEPSQLEMQERIRQLQELKAQSERPAATNRRFTWNDLSLTARVLAIDLGDDHQVKVQNLIEKFAGTNLESASDEPVTPSSFDRFAEALRSLDPEFEKSWRQSLRRDYPWLDRTLPDAFR